MAAKSAWKKHKAKPTWIHAIQFVATNKDDILEALTDLGLKASYSSKTGRIRVDTGEHGVKYAKPGDYFVKFGDGCVFVDQAQNFEENFVV